MSAIKMSHSHKAIQLMLGLLFQYFCSAGHVSIVKTLDLPHGALSGLGIIFQSSHLNNGKTGDRGYLLSRTCVFFMCGDLCVVAVIWSSLPSVESSRNDLKGFPNDETCNRARWDVRINMGVVIHWCVLCCVALFACSVLLSWCRQRRATISYWWWPDTCSLLSVYLLTVWKGLL